MDFRDYLLNERAYERRLRKQDAYLPDDSIFKTVRDNLYKPELDKLTEADVRRCGIPFVECNGLLLPRDIAHKNGWGVQTTAYGKCNIMRLSAIEHRRLYLGEFDP